MTPGQDELSDLLPLLRHLFGSGVVLMSYRVLKRLPDYRVLRARLRQPCLQVVVKLAGPEARRASQFERTARLHALVASQTQLPMAEVLGFNMSTREWPWRYLVQAHVTGRNWAVVREKLDAEGLRTAYRQFGEAAAQLHSLRYPGFGELGSTGMVCLPQPLLPALVEHAGAIIQKPALRELFLEALEPRRELFQVVQPACLVHEDLHAYNLLFRVRQGKPDLAAILDFEKAWGGPAESDLARLEVWRGMTRRSFWEAYNAVHPVDAGYALRRPVYQLLWCLEYAQHSPQHVADTQQVGKALGVRIPDEIFS
jgi:aminoglycoside phosphotransferase (APT) family kinase protein